MTANFLISDINFEDFQVLIHIEISFATTTKKDMQLIIISTQK